MPRADTPSAAGLVRPALRPRCGDGWDALADIEMFVFAVEAELEATGRERVGVHRRGRKPDPALRRRLIGLIWTLTFGACNGALPAGSPAFLSLHHAGELR